MPAHPVTPSPAEHGHPVTPSPIEHAHPVTPSPIEDAHPVTPSPPEHAPENAMVEPGEVARFYDRCSDLMRELLDELAALPDRPRAFPAIEDAIGWPHRRIASVLGGVCRLRRMEFSGRRPYHFREPRDAASRRWEMWMDGAQAQAVRVERDGVA